MSILTLRPNAAGDETSISFQQPGTGSHYDKVDEVTPDTTTYVHTTSASYQRDLYGIPDHTAETGAINHITVYFRIRCSDAVANAYAKPSIKSNSTVTDGIQVAHPYTYYTTYSQQWDTNPADSLAWDWSDIDALQVGVSLMATAGFVVRCTQVYVEVDYSPAALEWTLDETVGLNESVVRRRSLIRVIGRKPKSI